VNFWQKYVLLFFGQNLWIYPKIVFCIIVRLIDGYNSLDDIASYFLNLPLQKHILLFFGQNLWIYSKIVFCINVRLIDGYNSLENIASYFLHLPLKTKRSRTFWLKRSNSSYVKLVFI